VEVEHHPCDKMFLAQHRGHLAYRKAYRRAQVLGFVSVYGFLKWKLKNVGETVFDVSLKLAVSPTTIRKWAKLANLEIPKQHSPWYRSPQ